MSNFFCLVNEVVSHNKSRQSDLALENFWVTQYGWLKFCTIGDMGMTINYFWKLFRHVLKRGHYDKFIGISELLERIAVEVIKYRPKLE